ncbi:hypothetical protein AGABI2DRAFT_179494 [Agaricus bisporus var. bisporus H97]|uniref:hypothetical protein n=1 Tax=Agaricus bisporus var. bisporus (strain H97 / ATCC MYA-4626 / FGSC 10389) TaxID=936046 RepID=UPI00029F7F4C|nr:hypothetical protein AGABI2DRAFT_179494 [Agaricus bisporus var. bisporus H97]EKV46092.1 hypothetical protein AGABI2DRAFT_179494 [Agaricus bisporus var. bisporus H97]
MHSQESETTYFESMNSDDDGVKESFLLFSQTIQDLDIQLDKFANGSLRLGHVTGLLSAIKEVREMLQRTREIFFRNATALVPELHELAYRECTPEARGSSSERFYIPSRYFKEHLPLFDALPTVLQNLAASFSLLHVRTDEFQEFTYRASCAKFYSDRLNTTVIQRYIHQFIYDLQTDFDKIAGALSDFTAIGVPAIRNEQARISTTLANILAAATLFSGVTASTLQISMGQPDQNKIILVVNTLWFTSLILSVGLSVFTFSSNQASYTPYIIIASMVLASAGLGAILIWILYKFLMAPKEQADAIRSSGDSIHSGSNEISLFPGRIAVSIKNALPWSFSRKVDHPRDDVEQADEKNDELEESPSQEHDLPDRPKAKLQEGFKNVGIVNSALDAVAAASRKRSHGYKTERQLKPKLQSDNSAAAVPLTELILPDEPISKIELGRYGTIRDVSYSDDGKWLGVTWWAVSAGKRWSPSGKKLIVKFEQRFDVWDLNTGLVHVIVRNNAVKDVTWFDDDAFLVAEHSCVFKMMAEYHFEHTHIRSIGIERENNYLVLITKSLVQGEPASGRSERRIVIYDMDKQEEIYQVPVLEDIACIWSLDAGIRGAEITARLKKRTITPHLDPENYVGPTCMGGNHHQFIFSVTKSGNIDIWRRESGMPYLRFQSSRLRDEGVHCFSWRRSDDKTAIFATTGIHGRTLLVWRGEEPRLPETPDSLESLDSFSPKFAMNENSRNRWQRAVDMAVAPSSGSSAPRGIDQAEEISTESSANVDRPDSLEVGPTTSHS